MGGYIGARAGSVGATLANIQDVTATDTSPEVTLVNNTHEDTDGGREGKIIFKGQQSGGEESTLAEIQASHDGTADDEKGDLIFRTNDGSDGSSPTERLRIDSAGSIIPATLGTNNTHLGDGAGESIASGGQRNTFVGSTSGQSTTTGDFNSALGNNSLNANVTGTHNTAIGDFSLALNTGNENTAVGQGSLEANTSGGTNTAVGKSALGANDTASNNTAVGYTAGLANTTGNSNTYIGKQAGLNNTTSSFSTYLGYVAGESTTGEKNTFLGQGAGSSVTTGAKNTIIGRYNGNQNGRDIRTSNNNIVLSDGDGNVRAWCDNSGMFLHTDSHYYPTYRGVVGGSTDTPNVISARFTSGPNVADGTMQCIIDKHSTTNTTSQWFLGFTINNQSTASGVITANGASQAAFTSWSDRRLKENIVDLPPQLDNIMSLRPVEFDYIEDEGGGHQISFIAQEIEEVYPDTVGERPDGMKTLSGWSKTEARLVKALQEAVTKIETLETENTAIKARLDALEAE